MQQRDRTLEGQGRGRGRWVRAGGLISALVVLLLVATGVGTASAATLVSDDFEDGNAAGWVTTGGTWIVARETSRVLHQSSFAANALARTGSGSWRDYVVTADIRPTSFNGLPGFVGVVARASSTGNFYALVLRPDGTVALTRTVGGTATTLAAASLAVSAGSTYRASVRVAGQRLTGSVGGVTVTASDGFLQAGPGGLVTTWATASFDNVTIGT